VSETQNGERARVLIAGGGIAGLEALLALRELAGDRVAVTLASPEPDFTYKPLTVSEPFSFQPAERHELEPAVSELGATFVQQGLAGVDAAERIAELTDGSELAYDAAIVCVGGRPRAAYREAVTFMASGEPLEIDRLLRECAEADSSRLAFVVPPGVTWPLPLYELALMSRRRAAELGLDDVECVIVTPESGPLIMFGPLASGAVADLLAGRGIRVMTGTWTSEADDGGLELTPAHEGLDAGRVIALPVMDGPKIEGLSVDEQGFIPVDDHSRVRGADGLYAAGDGTNFPVKQGGLATQQADAAAEHIAASVGAKVDPQPFHPILRGQLLTGDESLSLRSDLTGGAGEGIASADYLWWPPHKVSGRYLAPWLAGEEPHDPEPPRHSIQVEVALPKEWHREPMALDPYEPLDLGEG